MKTPYVTFTTKLGVVATILLLEALLIGSCWWAGALGQAPATAVSELPPLDSLTETNGTVIGFTTSHRRTRSYFAPIVAFSAAGNPYQIGTRAEYNREAIPFKLGDTALVLYDRTDPAGAWLKWEYEERLRQAAAPRFADILATISTWVAYGSIGVTLVLLLIYVATPIKRDV